MIRRAIGLFFLLLLGAVTGCATRAVDRTEIAKLGNSEMAMAPSSENQKYFSSEGKIITDPDVLRAMGMTTPPYEVLKDKAFLGLLQTELDDCRAVFDTFGSGAYQAGNWEIGIAAVGIIAGSIIVPTLAAKAAAKSAIAAWGGVSGAANAAQLTLNAKGRSYDVLMLSQKSLNTSIKAQMAKLKDVKTSQEASAFIYELYSICKFPTTERSAAAT